nr:insulin receptor substrate 1 isoform X1 [Leptinotarsa decemlineata]
MSVKSVGNNRGGEVLRSGFLKKLKTSRKKWFVLRAETPECSARLEYYDTEKKFNAGQAPKRSIPLKTCFNINKRIDTKHKHVIALYTKDDCFCVVLDSEEELDGWLKALLSLQHGEEAVDGEDPKPTFEHVWQVVILNRGLGTDRIGNYRLCLTDKTLSLIKKEGNNSAITLNLSNIRSCGSLKNYFFLEVGRSSLLGAGELWMESEDTNIAQNIHTTIFHAMSTNNKHDEMRIRSSSATECSKPNNAYRKQVVSGLPKAPYFIQTVGATPCVGTTISHQRTQSLPLTENPTTTYAPPTTDYFPTHPSSRATTNNTTNVNKRSNQSAKCRERCDSMPSRPRTTSEGPHVIPAACRPYLTPHRSHGQDISHSPPSGSPLSPPSVGCSTDSMGSSYSLTDETDMCMGNECPETMRYSGPLTPDEAIAEEDCPESPCGMYGSYVPMAPPSSDDGYVDMSPRSRLNTHSPSVSVSSVVSGTPSTDIRFSDYPLDKVSSYFVTENDDTRPARAYSVGSRPEENRDRRHVGLAGTPEDPRVRSFSMGSKTKKGPSRLLQHHQHAGGKSISAPLLSNSRSHSSIDPMDNLMEMDFSKGSNNALNNNSTKTPSGYVEMKPGVEIIPRRTDPSPYMDMSGSAPYMDMSGGSPKTTEYTSFVDINRQYRLPMNNNYVDMDHRKNKVKTATSPAVNADYLDMTANQQSRRLDRSSSSASSPKNSDYMPLSFFQQDQAKTPDGYVEMTLGKKHQRQSSLDSNHINAGGNEDYLNMSIGPKKKPVKKEKAMSQPISIHPTTSSQVTKNSSSPISSLLSRKSSGGSSPKMHLPLSTWSTPYSSLPRQRARKDSRDSSSSSLTTPSSSSTIFPMSLNSPSSPMKPAKIETSSALKFPATLLNAFYKNNNKTNSSSNDYAPMDFEIRKNGKENNPSDYVNYAPAVDRTVVDDPMSDYAMMQPGTSEPSKVSPLRPVSGSYESGTSPLIGHLSMIGIKESQSMCFRPIKEDPKTLSMSGGAVVEMEKPSTNKSSSAPETSEPRSSSECVSPAAKISRPNSVDGDKPAVATPARPLDAAKAATSRPNSTSSELWSSSSTLVSSRPESVNSDRVQVDNQTEKLHYASLDLAQAQEEEESCSPRSSIDPIVPESTFIYAEIDFMKSEGLKQSSSQTLLSNAKVKH